MTKVGVYAIARVTTLVFGADAGAAAAIAQPWLPALALATLVLGAAGALAARRLRLLIAYLIVASAGTLLTAIGLGTPGTVAAGLFYLINSTVVAAAMFLLVDRIALARGELGDALEPAPLGVQRAAQGAAFFLFAVALAGLPPLAGFLGKALLLDAARETTMALGVWVVVTGAGLAVIVALARAGSTVFWRAGAPAPGGSGGGEEDEDEYARDREEGGRPRETATQAGPGGEALAGAVGVPSECPRVAPARRSRSACSAR